MTTLPFILSETFSHIFAPARWWFFFISFQPKATNLWMPADSLYLFDKEHRSKKFISLFDKVCDVTGVLTMMQLVHAISQVVRCCLLIAESRV